MVLGLERIRVIAANILVGGAILIPVTAMLVIARGEPLFSHLELTLLMVAGIILADTIGRVFYQKALNTTGNDNGFVTMFQNLEPGIAALIAFCLSPWIEGLRFEAGPDLELWVRAQSDLLIESVLGNLISNAIKFSNRDSAIRLTCERVGTEVRIVVADDGPGLPSEVLRRQRMGGRLELRNRDGGGAEATVWLPAVA